MSNKEVKDETQEVKPDLNTSEILVEEIEKSEKKTVTRKTRRLKKEVIIIGCLAFLIVGVLFLQQKKSPTETKDDFDETVYTALVFDEPMKQILKVLTSNDRDQEKLFNSGSNKIEYSDIKNYREENLERYQAYHALHPELLTAEVIWRVNVNFDYDLYSNIEFVENPSDYTAVVNKHYKLDGAYVPSDLVLMDSISEEFYLREEANTMFKEMQEAMAKKDLGLGVEKAYVNHNTLNQEYNAYVNEFGEEKALYGSAKAGHSEYQLGLALVVNDANNVAANFNETDAYHWLSLNAHRFGFIFRYEAPEEVTGYTKNHAHLRYVGKDVAVDMYEKNINILEEYLDKHGN